MFLGEWARVGLVVASVADEGWATEPFLSFRATTWGSQVCYVQQIGRAGGGRRAARPKQTVKR